MEFHPRFVLISLAAGHDCRSEIAVIRKA